MGASRAVFCHAPVYYRMRTHGAGPNLANQTLEPDIRGDFRDLLFLNPFKIGFRDPSSSISWP